MFGLESRDTPFATVGGALCIHTDIVANLACSKIPPRIRKQRYTAFLRRHLLLSHESKHVSSPVRKKSSSMPCVLAIAVPI